MFLFFDYLVNPSSGSNFIACAKYIEIKSCVIHNGHGCSCFAVEIVANYAIEIRSNSNTEGIFENGVEIKEILYALCR